MNNRETWLEARNRSIGGSEAATVLGENPYSSPLQLLTQKRGLAPPIEETQAMRMGHKLEPVVAELYCEETGRTVVDLGQYTIQRRDDYPYMHATLDRRINPCEGHDMPGVLQAKTAGHHMKSQWDAWDDDEDGDTPIPMHVMIQLQHEMWVSQMDWGSVAVLIGGQDFRWVDVTRNEDFCITRLVPACKAFMQAVESGATPEDLQVTASDGHALRMLYPQHSTAKKVMLPDKADEWASRIEEFKADVKWRTAAIDEYENKIKLAIGDAEFGELPGGGVYSWRTSKRKGFTVEETITRTLRRKK